MFAILGATGKVGGATARELRRRGLPVRAIVRDTSSEKARALAEARCEIAVADIRDVGRLAEVLAGVEAALVLCPLARASADVRAESAQICEALREAIVQARPRHVVALSDYSAHRASGTGIALVFHDLEQRLRTLPVATTLLRSAEHTENWTRALRSAGKSGVFPTCHQPLDRAIPTVWSGDVGVIAADLLAGPPCTPGTARVVHVEGARRYTPAEMAATAEALVGHPIQVVELPSEEWQPMLMAAGLGESHARLTAEMYAAHNVGLIDVEDGGEVRRGTTTLAQAYAAILGHEAVAVPRMRGGFA
jgi:uncharacterized protein YbjT (DUF2867 family)